MCILEFIFFLPILTLDCDFLFTPFSSFTHHFICIYCMYSHETPQNFGGIK